MIALNVTQSFSVMEPTRILMTILPCIITSIFAIGVLLLRFNSDFATKTGKTIQLIFLVFGSLVYLSTEVLVGEKMDDTYAGYSLARNGLSMLTQFWSLFIFVKTKPTTSTIGHHHEGIQYFTSILTILITCFEIATLCLRCRHDKKSEGKVNSLYAVVSSMAIVQKIVQAVVYQWVILKRKLSKSTRVRKATILWCIMHAMYNLSMWVQSIVEESHEHKHDGVNKNWSGNEELQQTYYALIIDYRLLFALLYLEHAYSFVCEGKGDKDMEPSYCFQLKDDAEFLKHDDGSKSNHIENIEISWKTIILFNFIGLAFTCSQIADMPFMVDKHGAPLNIVGILAEVSVACLCIFTIYKLNCVYHIHKYERTNRDFDLMVASLGIIGAFFWIVKAFHVSVMAKNDHSSFLVWYCVKFWFRSINCFLTIVVYMQTNVSVTFDLVFSDSKTVQKFLVISSLFFWFYIGVFINSVSENVYDKVNAYLRESDIRNAASWIHAVGTPVYLGYVVHLFIHHLMFGKKLLDAAKNRRNKLMTEQTTAQEKRFLNKTVEQPNEIDYVA